MSTDASATRLRNGGVLFADGLGPREPGAWKRLLFPAIWLVYLGQTASGVNAHSSGAAAVAGYVIIGLFAVGYVWALASTRWHRRRYWAIFAAMVALTAAETVFAREDAAEERDDPVFAHAAAHEVRVAPAARDRRPDGVLVRERVDVRVPPARDRVRRGLDPGRHLHGLHRRTEELPPVPRRNRGREREHPDDDGPRSEREPRTPRS